MKRLRKHTFSLGLAIIFAGFLYDAFFAGLPYPDPTPEIQEQYELHSMIANTIMQIGFAILIIGILLKIFIKKQLATVLQNKND